MSKISLKSGPATSVAGTPPVPDDVMVEFNVMVRMRDGVHLATDIYRPKTAPGPLPVIMERTPYNKAGTTRTELSVTAPDPLTRSELATKLVREGYAVVLQDCRGRYASEGTFTKYLSEGEDGFDAMEWVIAQDWCNGRIGTMGLSYGAHTQMAAACLNPPGLVCMAIDSGGFSNAFTCGIRQGGAFELKQATWAYHRAMEGGAALTDPRVRPAVAAENLFDWFHVMPWTKGRSPIRWNPEYEDYLLEQWQHGTFDAFWKKVGIYAAGYYDTFPKAATILMSSWYDAYVQTTLENFEGLKGDPERPLVLIMGPWTHGNRSRAIFGDVDFGAAATFDGQVDDTWLDFRLKWFDRWLKGNTPVNDPAPVHLFVMGTGQGGKTEAGHLNHGGKWIRTEDWPPPEAKLLDLHLHPDMKLETAPCAADAELSYNFDPAHPVPTIGGSLTSGEPIFTGGGFNQIESEEFFGCTHPGMPLSARPDVLSFETEPLAEDTLVAGPVEIDLWVTSDMQDTDFTAKLVDFYPPCEDYPRGYALNITDGIFRCRYRNGFDRPEPIAAGEVFQITIRPFATANMFKKGHRIRLDISSSNFPKYDVNPNTWEKEGTSRRRQTAVNTLFMAPGRESRMRLRVIPD